MASWLVKLTGIDTDLEAVAELFRIPRVTREHGGYYLRWSVFNELPTPDQVRAYAGDLLWRISALERVRCGSSFPVAAKEVFLEQPDGSRQDYFQGDLTLSCNVRHQHIPMSESDVEMFSRWIAISTKDAKVEKGP